MTVVKPSFLGGRRHAEESRNNASAGDERATQRARDFRFAASAIAVTHRNFKDAQASACGFHLHFQIPAVSFLAQVKLCERITSDSAEGAHVCVTNAIESLHYPSGYSPR